MKFSLFRRGAEAEAGEENTLGERIAIQEAERLRKQVERLEREVDAERAENVRLVRLLAASDRPNEPGMVPPLHSSDYRHWRAEAERHKATAAKLDNLLAAADGRPVHGSAL